MNKIIFDENDFKKKYTVFLVCFLIAFFSLRGWFVLNLNIPTSFIYPVSAVMMTLLSIYSFYNIHIFKDSNLLSLKKIFLFNIFFGVYFIFSEVFMGSISISLIYVFLAPYLFFLFIRIPIPSSHLTIFIIATGICFSILHNYYNVLSGSGYDYIRQYNMILRPDLGEYNISRSGDFIRVGGYTGSYHDSAHILGMLTTFFYTYFLINRVRKYLLFSILTLVCLLMTLSAANILIAIFCCILTTIYILYKQRSFAIYMFILIFVISIYLIFPLFPILTGFLDRVGSQGDYEGMTNALSVDMLSSIHFWFGHGYIFESELLITEVALIKGIHQFGLIVALIIYTLLLYPIWFYVRNPNALFKNLPYLIPILFAFMSLLHYGSLFKVTNIGIFYLFYALFFKTSLARLNKKIILRS
jgi:hypothetical protein